MRLELCGSRPGGFRPYHSFRPWVTVASLGNPLPLLAHLSDLHTTPLELRSPRELVGKRALGWLSWQLRRKRIHRADILESLLDDLREQSADHVVVTGDLTNVSLDSEVDAARRWLEKIGPPDRVTAIPGNHDAYVPSRHASTWERWGDYMAADAAAAGPVAFPALRIRGSLALVGVSSAQPNAVHRAGGRLGAGQRERLEEMLLYLSESKLCRIVLVHHSPIDGVTTEGRSLWDRGELRALLRRAGAELVLHGHNHRTWIGAVPGPHGPIPVVGARSSSEMGSRPGKRAQYHLYQVEESGGHAGVAGRPRFRIHLRARSYETVTRRFRAEGERWLA